VILSVFHRSIRNVVWVAFALLALLPILALLRMGMLFLSPAASGSHTTEMTALALFAVISLAAACWC